MEPQAPRAPSFPIGEQTFYSIEYPGYVKEESFDRAIELLGGSTRIAHAFKNKKELLELTLRPEDRFAHPISGDILNSANLLLKVTKRRRKPKIGEESQPLSQERGQYTAEVAGIITKTVRFRSMADFQFRPDPDDPITKISDAIYNLDAATIHNFSFAPEKEDYVIYDPDSNAADGQGEGGSEPLDPRHPRARSNVRLFPPPLFSRQGIQHNWNYRSGNVSQPITVVDPETGEEKTRLVNKHRIKGAATHQISMNESEVPSEPPDWIKAAAESRADPVTLTRIQKMFEERPIWYRAALNNMFDTKIVKESDLKQVYLPLVSYGFRDGAFRDLLIQYGYDPRKNVEDAQYQRLHFRDLENTHMRVAPSAQRWKSKGGAASSTKQDKTSHIFDGQTFHIGITSFQICDIADPILTNELANPVNHLDTYDPVTGWYTPEALERARDLLRAKYLALKRGEPPMSDVDSARFLRVWKPNGTKRQEAGYGDIDTRMRKPTFGVRRGQNRAKKVDEPEARARRLRLGIAAGRRGRGGALGGRQASGSKDSDDNWIDDGEDEQYEDDDGEVDYEKMDVDGEEDGDGDEGEDGMEIDPQLR